MCFGSTTNIRRVSTQPATAPNTTPPAGATSAGVKYNEVAAKIDAEYVLAATNKKGRRTVDAFDILGSLVRAQRDGNTYRVLSLLDEYVADFR